MPNWCEGTLKVRGNYEDVRRWAVDALKCYNAHWTKDKDGMPQYVPKLAENGVIIEITNGDELCISVRECDAHITGTRRHFIKKGEYSCFLQEKGNRKIARLCMNFEAAWKIDIEPLLEMSKKYDIDFCLHGYECGAEFNQSIIVEHGKIIKNEVIQFDDYAFECPFPNLGG